MATFTNQAVLSYNGNVTNSNIITGQIQEVLAMNKRPLIETYMYGDTITYLVNMINSGSTDLSSLDLTMDLGKYDFNAEELVPLTYVKDSSKFLVNGVEQTLPTVDAGPPLKYSGFTIPAGSNATIVYQAKINEYAPLSSGSNIINTATLSTGATAIGTESATITVKDAPNLAISKSLSPAIVSAGEELVYTFTIQNYGNTNALAADQVAIKDTFDPILDPISVKSGTSTWVRDTDYRYTEATGVFETIGGKILVGPAQYEQDTTTGVWTIIPGITVLTVTGTV